MKEQKSKAGNLKLHNFFVKKHNGTCHRTLFIMFHHIIGGRYIEGLNLTSNYLRLNCGSDSSAVETVLSTRDSQETVPLVRRPGDFPVVRYKQFTTLHKKCSPMCTYATKW